MLITIHYPIADLRHLGDEPTGRLDRPGWPFPLEGKQYVRFLGAIMHRPRGGLNGWGEDSFCVADRGIRFVGLGPFKNGSTLRRHFAFRRLYFDGRLAARFEVGLALTNAGPAQEPISLDAEATTKFIEDFLATPLSISDAFGKRTLCDVASAVDPLRCLYYRATTKKSAVASRPSPSWWVEAGRPVLYLERLEGEAIEFPYRGRPGPPLRAEFGLAIQYREVSLKKARFPMWVATLKPGFDRTVARHLRLSLVRLHEEYECLGLLLDNLTSARISGDSKVFTDCLLESFVRIGKSESTTRKLAGKDRELADLSLAVSDAIDPGRRDSILESLEKADPSLRSRADALYSRKGDIVNNFNLQNSSDVQVNVDNQGTISKTNVTTIDNINLTELSGELEKLQSHLATLPDGPEKKEATEDLAAAKAASDSNNRSKILEALKRSGTWLLGVAKDVGVPIAIIAIKAALGMAAIA